MKVPSKIIPEGAEHTFPTVFNEALEEAKKLNINNIYVLITAGLNEDGIPWCPDCRTGQPMAIEAVNKSSNAYYVEGSVRRVDWKGVDTHPYKCSELLKAERIPTLYKFVNGTLAGKLVESEVSDQAKLDTFVQ